MTDPEIPVIEEYTADDIELEEPEETPALDAPPDKYPEGEVPEA